MDSENEQATEVEEVEVGLAPEVPETDRVAADIPAETKSKKKCKVNKSASVV